MHKNSNNNNNLPALACLDYLSLDLRSQLSHLDLLKVSIDTPFRPSIDTTTELSIDDPSSELYRAGLNYVH